VHRPGDRPDAATVVAFRGTVEAAEKYRREVAGEYGERPGAARAALMIRSATCSNGGCRLIIRGVRRRR